LNAIKIQFCIALLDNPVSELTPQRQSMLDILFVSQLYVYAVLWLRYCLYYGDCRPRSFSFFHMLCSHVLIIALFSVAMINYDCLLMKYILFHSFRYRISTEK